MGEWADLSFSASRCRFYNGLVEVCVRGYTIRVNYSLTALVLPEDVKGIMYCRGSEFSRGMPGTDTNLLLIKNFNVQV